MLKSTITKSLCLAIMLMVGLSSMAQTTPDNWEVGPKLKTYQESTIFSGGANAAKIEAFAGGNGERELISSVEIPVVGGQKIKVSSKVYHTSSKVKVRYKYTWTGSKANYSGGYSDYKNLDSWTDLVDYPTVPEDATGLKIGFRVYKGDGFEDGAVVYIDDVQAFIPVGTEVIIANGDMESWPEPPLSFEPSAYPTDLLAYQIATEMDISWSADTEGDIPAEGHLVIISPAGDAVSLPVDGVEISDNLDLNDGTGYYNADDYESSAYFTIPADVAYQVSIFPFTTFGGAIDYKTDGSYPNQNVDQLNELIFEDFEEDLGSFTGISVSGDQAWEIKNKGYFGTNCAYMNGYSGSSNANEDWLISSTIAADSYDNLAAWFQVSNKYSGNPLLLKVSSDYDGAGDPATATWTEIPFNHAYSGKGFSFSGKIDLSAYSGNIHLAFVYTSTDAKSATWRIDDYMLSGDPKVPTIAITAPNGADNIEQASAFEITWNIANWDGNVNIYLSRPGQDDLELASNIAASTGTFTWNVAADQVIAADYSIKIKGVTAGDPEDTSDQVFNITAVYVAPSLVISEIMYNPPESGADSLEYIEVYNAGVDAVNLQGMRFSKGVVYTFEEKTLEANAFVVVGVNAEAIKNTFNAEEVLQWTSGGLKNGGEAIVLVDALDNVIDEVTYGKSLPWDTLANGYGHSLVLCDLTADNSLAESWKACPVYVGKNADDAKIYGTPGNNDFGTLNADVFAGSVNVLEGYSLIFENDTEGFYTSLEWTFEGGDPATSIEENPMVNYPAKGEYDITLTVANGCASSTFSKEDMITVYAEPSTEFTADVTEIVEGDMVVFSADDADADAIYIWTFDGARDDYDDIDPTHVEVTYPERGSFDVELMAMFGTFDITTSKEDYIVVGSVGLEENAENSKFEAYPQPAKKYLTVKMKEAGQYEMRILNIQGQLVKTLSEQDFGIKLDISDLPSGGYFIQMLDLNTQELEVKKLIIQ